MSKKLIFAVDKGSYNLSNHIGVRKKVESQIAAFKKSGLDVSLYQYEWANGIPDIKLPSDTDILFFRTTSPSVKLCMMLKRFKKDIPGLRIVMEVPTYLKGAKEKNRSIKRIINESLGELLWHTCLDKIVLIMNDDLDKLYDVPVIHATNGIFFDSIRPRKAHEDDTVNLIAVSGCYYWHGYDRILRGMGEYYKGSPDREVNLYIVGDGDKVDEYISIAREYDLYEKHIFLCGVLDGEKLDDMYDKCDIALESFGGHRNNCLYSSSLKSREYAAKGMPIVTAIPLLDYENETTEKWIMKCPADESPIDIKSIVDFYDRIYHGDPSITKAKVPDMIRDGYRQLCDIEFTHKDVIDYLIG